MVGFGTSIPEVSRRQQNITQSKLCLHSPIPVQEKFRLNRPVQYYPKVAHGLFVFPQLEFGTPGEEHSDSPGQSRRSLRFAAHCDLAKPSSPFEIQGQCAYPRFERAKNGTPWIVSILLGHFFPRPNNSECLSKVTEVEQSEVLANELGKINLEARGLDHVGNAGFGTSENFPIAALKAQHMRVQCLGEGRQPRVTPTADCPVGGQTDFRILVSPCIVEEP